MTDDFFPRDTEGLTEVVPTRTLRLRDGDHIDLRISPVTKHLGGDVLRMLAYDGSIPGPTLHVDQGSELTVHVKNDGDLEATVHWHGLRLENQYDGVPFETQSPIPIGGSYTQKITFPDAGFYWYHPHIREDYGLELGLYGTIIVEPSDPSYWPPADRHLTITLDDLLVEDGKVAPFRRSGPTYTAMGRFGNVMLINGDLELSAEAAVGEVVRLYVVNTANTRIFNVGLNGARVKLRRRRQRSLRTRVASSTPCCSLHPNAPSSTCCSRRRAMFASSTAPLIMSTTSARFRSTGSIDGEAAASFDSCAPIPSSAPLANSSTTTSSVRPTRCWPSGPRCRSSTATTEPRPTSRDRLPRVPDAPGDRRVVRRHLPEVRDEAGSGVSPEVPTPMPYACPMHDEIVAAWAASCPLCGMTLLRSDGVAEAEDGESVASQPRARRQHRVGRRHGRDQPPDEHHAT